MGKIYASFSNSFNFEIWGNSIEFSDIITEKLIPFM